MLVKSTVDLAHSLGMRVTAEGVEDAATMATLRRLGCDYAQGYQIGRPMAVESFIGRFAAPANVIA